MSTEHDDTRPVPAPPGDERTQPVPSAAGDATTRPVPTPSGHGTPGPAAEDATRPVPRTGTAWPEHPTQALGTAPEGAPGAGARAAAPGGPAGPSAGGPVGPPDPGVSRSVRVGTVVWGLVVAVVGAGVLAIAAGATVDLELALIGLLALAGVSLVVGSVVTAARQRRAGAATPGAAPGPGRTARARR